MTLALAFVLAAAAGALARAEVGRRWNQHDGFPFGTLAVNVTGALALGLLWEATPEYATAVGVGGLGAFTTFSSFARDAVALADQRRVLAAIAYVTVSCGAGVAAAAVGVAIA